MAMIFWKTASLKEKINRLREVFNQKVIKKDGCWGWNGSLLEGRGRIYYEKKAMQAHRASWIIHNGIIPSNKYVCHTCDNIICTNPDHLFLGSPSDNTRDMLKKGRRPHNKLNVEDVINIRVLLNNNVSGSQIAKKYSISPMTVSDIKLKRTWSYIT